MNDRYDLTKGNIIRQLLLVSLPIMGTSFVQMAYNLTDLFWLGKVSPDATSAAGIGGFFTWLGAAVFLLVKIGTEVRVSQRVGINRFDEAKEYAKTGVQLEIIFGLLYSIVLFVLAKEWIAFFNIQEVNVEADAIIYLQVISIGMVFYLLNPIFTAALNGTGNTFIPFLISATGLVFNIILDPVFILVLGWGVKGAAIATIIAQFLVSLIFIIYYKGANSILSKVKVFSKINKEKAKDILQLGIPVAIQSALFTFIAMVISRMVSEYGSPAISVQKVGSNIESLSWLVAGGISTALGTFVGQNFGAKLYDRVLKGIKYALITMSIYGVLITAMLYFLAGPMIKIFLDYHETIELGIDYLQILAFSQILMIVEATVGGAFNGLGQTKPASFVSIFFNLLRIPMALFFTKEYGLNGIWLAITISSILKGMVLYIWFKLYIKGSETFKAGLLKTE
jgi:putative MATE family efflux protein